MLLAPIKANWQDNGTFRWRLLTDASENLNVYAYDASGAFVGTAITFPNDGSLIGIHFPAQITTSNATIHNGVTGLWVNATNTGRNAAQGPRFLI